MFEYLNANQRVGDSEPVIYGQGGLSTLQIQRIEAKLGFPIPEDFAYLLQNVLDPGGVLFSWANFQKQQYDDKIQWVLEGIEFDIDSNGLWLKRWGERPQALSDALEIVRNDFKTWPKLLPIFGHRFLPAEPLRNGNPVFSIMQTDIIYYGSNLAHYLLAEFVDGSDKYASHTWDNEIKRVDIWSDFVDLNADFLEYSGEKRKALMAAIVAATKKRGDDGDKP